MARPTFPPGLVDIRGVAFLAGLSQERARWLAWHGDGPPVAVPAPPGGRNLYQVDQVRAWVVARECRRIEREAEERARCASWNMSERHK